jgi:hypothetical protein
LLEAGREDVLPPQNEAVKPEDTPSIRLKADKEQRMSITADVREAIYNFRAELRSEHDKLVAQRRVERADGVLFALAKLSALEDILDSIVKDLPDDL